MNHTVRFARSEFEAVTLAWELAAPGHSVRVEQVLGDQLWSVHVRPFRVESALTVDRSAIVEREEGGGVWVITLNDCGGES